MSSKWEASSGFIHEKKRLGYVSCVYIGLDFRWLFEINKANFFTPSAHRG